MKYQGGKSSIAKEILPLILKERAKEQWYIEPFVGGANMIQYVTGNRLGSDLSPELIKALTFIRDNAVLLPVDDDEFTEQMYHRLIHSYIKHPKDPIDCFALFAYSFGAKYRGGWARNKSHRDYVWEAYSSAQTQSPLLQGCVFKCSSYNKLKVPDKSIIYCDPPYAETYEYNGQEGFDSVAFWDWCDSKIKEGHKVFVSEYTAPADWKCIWSKKVHTCLGNDNAKQATEKLFTKE